MPIQLTQWKNHNYKLYTTLITLKNPLNIKKVVEY